MSLEARVDRSIQVLERHMVGRGTRLTDVDRVLATIRTNALLRFDDEASDAEIFNRILDAALAYDLPLSAQWLVTLGQPRQKSISSLKAVCLWLLAFRYQTLGLGGLWTIYVSLQDPTVELPGVVRDVFSPRREPGEEQAFIYRILDEISGQAGTISEVRAKNEAGHWTDDRVRVVDWVIATRLRPPRQTSAQQLVLLGENTLKDCVRGRVYREIDAIAGELRRSHAPA